MVVRLLLFRYTSAANTSAIIICTPLTRQYLINYARPLIYTTFMSYPALAAIKAAYTFMAQGRTEALAKDLNTLIAMLHSSLRRLIGQHGSSESIENLIETSRDCQRSPIISLFTPDPQGLAQYCQKAGYLVRAIMAPTVPEGFERVRVCLHSGNTLDQVEGFMRVLQQWIRREKQKRNEIRDTLEARL